MGTDWEINSLNAARIRPHRFLLQQEPSRALSGETSKGTRLRVGVWDVGWEQVLRKMCGCLRASWTARVWGSYGQFRNRSRDSPSGGNIAAEVGAAWLNLGPSVWDVIWFPSEGLALGGKKPWFKVPFQREHSGNLGSCHSSGCFILGQVVVEWLWLRLLSCKIALKGLDFEMLIWQEMVT